MPKNIKKLNIIKELQEDQLSQKDIAKKYNTSTSYISQLKKETKKVDYAQHLGFLYNFMDQYMQPTSIRPPSDYLNKIGKIGEIVDAIKG